MRKLFWLAAGVFLLLLVLASCLSAYWRRPVKQPVSLPDFLIKSRSSVQVGFPQIGEVTVYLYSSDEKQATIEAPYCGGGLGAKSYEGSYELILIKESEVVDRLPLGQLNFVEKMPFNGQLRLEALKSGKDENRFITLFQYISCNMNQALVFGYNENEEEELFEVPFLKPGIGTVAVYLDPNRTKLLAESSDRFISRFYDNSIGKFRVSEWLFNPVEQHFEEQSYWEE